MTRTELQERRLAALSEWSESLKAIDIAADELRKAKDWHESSEAVLRQLARIEEVQE